MVLGMNHDQRALAPRRRKHLENLPIVELERVVGCVDLKRRVTGLDQRRQLLAGDLLGRIGNDQVEGVVDRGLAIRAGVIILDHLSQRHAAILRGERNDGGGAAASRRARGGEEIVRRHDTHGRSLRDVTMAVDTARRDNAALGIDLPAAGTDFRADRHDAAVDHSDVGAEDVGRGRERSVAYDQIVFGHGACASRSDRVTIPARRRRAGGR